jgi:chorismate mutase
MSIEDVQMSTLKGRVIMSDARNPFYLVREDILPEALLKTVEAKRMLISGEAKTVHDAVKQVELSRSAFYKYKDGILLPSEWRKEWMVTISMRLTDRAGMLSRVLALVATWGGNVLTINQTIPLQGYANVTLTIDLRNRQELLGELIGQLQAEDGISDVSLSGQG